jgi:hypothetical protein
MSTFEVGIVRLGIVVFVMSRLDNGLSFISSSISSIQLGMSPMRSPSEDDIAMLETSEALKLPGLERENRPRNRDTADDAAVPSKGSSKLSRLVVIGSANVPMPLEAVTLTGKGPRS